MTNIAINTSSASKRGSSRALASNALSTKADGTGHRFALALIYLAILTLPFLLRRLVPHTPVDLTMSLPQAASWVVPIVLASLVRNRLNVIIAIGWLLWLLVGSINIVASFVKYGLPYDVDAAAAADVYCWFTCAYFIGLLVYERSRGRVRHERRAGGTPAQLRTNQHYADVDISGIFRVFLLVFPFALFATVYMSAGYVPILSGRNVNLDMYTTNFGILYGYSVVAVLSMLYLVERLRTDSGNKAVSIALLLFFAFTLTITGKRMWLMVFMVAASALYIAQERQMRKIWRIAVAVFLIALLNYVSLALLRAGDEGRLSTSAEAFSAVGVEYRDFAYALTNFDESQLADYSWHTSALASALNSSLLRLAGIDKTELVRMDFGFVAKPLFMGGDFGVRTGIVCELFFAYGWWGLPVLLLIGVLTAFLSARLWAARTTRAKLFLSVLYGLLALIVVENSIDVTGTTTVLGYTFALAAGLDLMERRSAPAVRRRLRSGESRFP